MQKPGPTAKPAYAAGGVPGRVEVPASPVTPLFRAREKQLLEIGSPLSPEQKEVMRLRAEIAMLKAEDERLEREKRRLSSAHKKKSSPTSRPLDLSSPSLVPELLQRFKQHEERKLDDEPPTGSPNAAQSASEEPMASPICKGYRVDLTASSFGVCKCGRPKSEHPDADDLSPGKARAAAAAAAATAAAAAAAASAVASPREVG